MAVKNLAGAFIFLMAAATVMASQVDGLMPYTRSVFDMLIPEDPFRILEHTPLAVPKATEPVALALACADWKETPRFHIIAVDIPGMKKEDVKIEVEENRVLRISGGRKEEQEVEGEKWHRAERTKGEILAAVQVAGECRLGSY